MFVEGWAPEYGAPFDPDEQMAPAEGTVDATVELTDWEPLEGVDDGIDQIAFVDGVRRIDARLMLDDPVAGPDARDLRDVRGRRHALASARAMVGDHGRAGGAVGGARRRPRRELPAVELDPPYRTATTPSDDPSHLIGELHTRMRRAEGELASRSPPTRSWSPTVR